MIALAAVDGRWMTATTTMRCDGWIGIIICNLSPIIQWVYTKRPKVRRVEVIARVDELNVNVRFHQMNPNVTIRCNVFRPRDHAACLGQRIVIAENRPRMRIYSWIHIIAVDFRRQTSQPGEGKRQGTLPFCAAVREMMFIFIIVLLRFLHFFPGTTPYVLLSVPCHCGIWILKRMAVRRLRYVSWWLVCSYLDDE